MSELTKDLFRGSPIPQRTEDWDQLDYLAVQLFTPHSPIDEEQLFAGRQTQIALLVDTVFQKGQHAILYGERGVGKTSLANVVKARVFARAARYRVTKRNCTEHLTFRDVWAQLFDDMSLDDGTPLTSILGQSPGAYEVFKAIESYPPSLRPIFILDEYDRIHDDTVHVKMADTIKYLSDNAVDATLIIIGVADDVVQLFGGHPSIQRNVRQVPMPLMSENELHLIFDTRMRELGMEMDEGTQKFIVQISQGLPGYSHLLGQNAVRVAIEDRSLAVGAKMMRKSMDRAINSSAERIQRLYADAVRSTKPNNNYRQALLACALARYNDRGYFSASKVKKPFSRIMGAARDFQTFNRHLKEFCEPNRGPALIRVGSPKSYEYKFSDALLRPYVVIKGLSDGVIKSVDLSD